MRASGRVRNCDGERGVTLSAVSASGWRWRAFLTQPRILILDDSSAVDSAARPHPKKPSPAQRLIRLRFLITHRLSQIRWADKVVFVTKGRVVAVGNHDELMQDFPAYRRILSSTKVVACSALTTEDTEHNEN